MDTLYYKTLDFESKKIIIPTITDKDLLVWLGEKEISKTLLELIITNPHTPSDNRLFISLRINAGHYLYE